MLAVKNRSLPYYKGTISFLPGKVTLSELSDFNVDKPHKEYVLPK